MTKRLLASLAGVAFALGAPSAFAQSGTLVLYTSQPNADAQATVDAFQAAHPDVEVEWVRDGTTKMMAKLRAEFAAGDPQPDVLLIADTVTMEGLAQEGRLMAYPEAPTEAYDAALHDAEGHYFSTKLITTGIVYNDAAPTPPTSWHDLTADAAENQVAMPSPLTSGAAAIHMETVVSHPDFGWDYYEALAANGIQPQGGNGGVFRTVASGEKLYGVVVDFLPIREAQNGSPVDFVFPTEGVSAVTEPVAILSTARNPEAAEAFVDFLLSREGQELAASQGYLPAHPEVSPPTGFPPRDEIALMPFDAGEALADDQANKQRFVEIFGQ
ncbi:MAG: ABC transporter substrate-binding protein [Alphaproteobacteria bacterium]